jgi:hypothetical protein
MQRLLVAPFVEPELLRHLAQNSQEWLMMIRHHINEIYGPSLTRAERNALGAMKHSPEIELPVSLWSRVWDRERLSKAIQYSHFIDVRTKAQLFIFLRGRRTSKFRNLFDWFIREIYQSRPRTVQSRSLIYAAIDHLDGRQGKDIEMDGFVFKRTAWGFNVYKGSRILAYSHGDCIFYLENLNSPSLRSLISDKFVFECCLGVYNHLIEVT